MLPSAWSLDAQLALATADRKICASIEDVIFSRRSLFEYAGLLSFSGAASRYVRAADDLIPGKADHTLRIGTGLVELSPEHIVSTT
jgi:hypothetical protein